VFSSLFDRHDETMDIIADSNTWQPPKRECSLRVRFVSVNGAMDSQSPHTIVYRTLFSPDGGAKLTS
jgi:hypothetical protein